LANNGELLLLAGIYGEVVSGEYIMNRAFYVSGHPAMPTIPSRRARVKTRICKHKYSVDTIMLSRAPMRGQHHSLSMKSGFKPSTTHRLLPSIIHLRKSLRAAFVHWCLLRDLRSRVMRH
jgi:hypothetical protein